MTTTQPEAVVRSAIARRGPIPLEEVVEAALYDPEGGFYTGVGRAGRRGDFLTSAEVGPLFGAVVARALDRWWEAAGSPAVFTVVEGGAGPGTLARSVLQAAPACLPALRYVLVERSPAQRALYGQHLALESPTVAFAALPEPDDDQPPVPPPPGPIVVSVPDLPRVPGPCVVLANELLDNLPFGLLERTADGWVEIHVGLEGDRLVEVPVPAATADIEVVEDLAPGAVPGARVPRPRAAQRWVLDALDVAGASGRVVAIDYAATTTALASRPWSEWVRTYRGHERGGPPLEALGSQDITCEVAFDQLGIEPDRVVSQARWLREHGIEDLVEEGRRTWQERAAIGDLAAVRGRSRAVEAEALVDPAGFGAFSVMEWTP